MIDLIRQLLPYSFLLFFIIKGNKEPLYLLGIPFLMFMSNSIFFDTVKIFNKPGSLSYMLLFLWLISLWLISLLARTNKKIIRLDKNHKLNILDFFILGLILISIFDLVITFINYPVTTDVFKEFVPLISLFAGYFIIKEWISRNTIQLLIKFLYSLVIINSISSFLFILHQGLHLNIYQTVEYLTDYVNGVEITRSFFFMPQLLFFSITFILVFKRKHSLMYWVLLTINLLAVFISYTRSYLIITVIIFLLYFVLTGLKKGNLGLILKNTLTYGIIGILGIFIISKILPNNTKYFMDRFNELSKSSSNEDPNNLQFRFMNTRNIISHIDANNKILGMGPVSEKQSSYVPQMRSAMSDMVWAGVIFRWGFIGLFLFILLYLFSLTITFKFYMKSEGVFSNMALTLFIYIIAQISESFVSWTFMSGHGLTTGLWYFAILSTMLGYNTNKHLNTQLPLSQKLKQLNFEI